MGQEGGGMLQPPFGGPHTTHVGMVFREPHLVKDGVCSSSVGYETGEFEVFFGIYLARQIHSECITGVRLPVLFTQVEVFQYGLVPPKKILGVNDLDGVPRVFRKYEGGPALAGEMAQAFLEAREDMKETEVFKRASRHFQYAFVDVDGLFSIYCRDRSNIKNNRGNSSQIVFEFNGINKGRG